MAQQVGGCFLGCLGKVLGVSNVIKEESITPLLLYDYHANNFSGDPGVCLFFCCVCYLGNRCPQNRSRQSRQRYPENGDFDSFSTLGGSLFPRLLSLPSRLGATLTLTTHPRRGAFMPKAATSASVNSSAPPRQKVLSFCACRNPFPAKDPVCSETGARSKGQSGKIFVA
jgi:hypothetical protein